MAERDRSRDHKVCILIAVVQWGLYISVASLFGDILEGKFISIISRYSKGECFRGFHQAYRTSYDYNSYFDFLQIFEVKLSINIFIYFESCVVFYGICDFSPPAILFAKYPE